MCAKRTKKRAHLNALSARGECTGHARKYRCTSCVSSLRHTDGTLAVPVQKPTLDDSTTEEVELAKTVTQTTDDRQSRDSTRYDTEYSQLLANHQTTTTLLQNLETAINNLAGQVHRAEEIRGDAMAHLTDTLSAGHQDRLPAATGDQSTQTTPTQAAHLTVTTDRAVQVSGRALPLPPPSPHPPTSSPLPPADSNTPISPPLHGAVPPSSSPWKTNLATRGRTRSLPATPKDKKDSGTDGSETSSTTSDSRSADNTDHEATATMEDCSHPRLLILHDSIMKGVDPVRLCHGYGLHVTKKKAATITDCLQTAEKPTPHEAILIHTGVNDLKTTGAQDASHRLVTCVKTILTKNEKAHVIVSKTTPTSRPDLTAKRELFNALCFTALHDSDRVTFVAHDNTQIGDDGLHLTPRGASIMAGNTGRHVVGLFWQKQRSRGHRRPRHQQANRPTDTDNRRRPQHQQANRLNDTDNRRGPSRRTSLPQQQQPPQNHRHYQPPGNRYKDSFPTGGSLQLQHHQPERRGHYWREDSQRGGVTTGERTAREEGSLLERGQPERRGHYWREDSQRGGVTTGERTAREEGSLLERGQPERRGHYWREDSQRGGVTTGERTAREEGSLLERGQPERRGHYWRGDGQGNQQGQRERDDPRQGRHHYDYRRDHQPSAYQYRHRRDW